MDKKVNLSPTERVDPAGREFDRLSLREQLNWLLLSQAHAIEAVKNNLEALALAVESAAVHLRGSNGRLIYAGAGCSIRIAVQDGVELVPTFGWPLDRLKYLIAGGQAALATSVEGAEDDTNDAISQVDSVAVSHQDVVIGVAASGNTAFTVSALAASRALGALTIGVTSNPYGEIVNIVQHALVIETGHEVLAGSTRLGAGTAQKALLNTFSTALMTQLGRVFGNQMLCVKATNAKLKDRQARILSSQVESLSHEDATKLLATLDWDLRVGLLVASGCSEKEARAALNSERPFRDLFDSH